MRPVNLLPRDTRRAGRSTRYAWLGPFGSSPLWLVPLAVLVLLSALLALAYVRESGKVDERRETRDALRKELAEIPQPAADRAPSSRNAAALRLAALSTAASSRIAWDRVLSDVSRVMPGDTWLTTLAAKSPVSAAAVTGAAPTPGAAPTAFTATGFTYSQDSVARLLSRLALVPGLSNVSLQSSSFTNLGPRRVVQFTVLADVQPTEAAS